MAQELKAVEPVIEESLTSTTSIRNYVLDQAKLKGIDPVLVDKIVSCESGYVPQKSKYQGEESYGIWQFNLPSWQGMTQEQAMDVVYSTDKALSLLKEGKQNLWTCARK